MVRLMVVLGLVLSLAACAGSSRTDGLSKAEEEALQERVDAAEAATLNAEAEKGIARAEAAIARADTVRAEAAAEEQRQLAETAGELAESEQQLTETAREETASAREAAQAAERARQALADENEETRQQALQAEAIQALAGLAAPMALGDPVTDVNYTAPAVLNSPVGVTPGFTFTNPSPRGSSSGRWLVTTAHNRGQDAEDTIVVYSDVGAPEPTPITSKYLNRFTAVSTVDNRLQGPIQTGDSDLIKSPAPLWQTGGRVDDIPLTDRDNDPATDDQTAPFSGMFHGAPGTFWCEGTGTCTVKYDGKGYVLAGSGTTWNFRTSSPNPMVKVEDAEFMYFGSWRRETTDSTSTSTGTFAYHMFSQPATGSATVAGNQAFNLLQESAIYEGPAIGQYAVPLGNQLNHGEFEAKARFTANFGDVNDGGTLSGTVFGFDVSPSWTLTLKEADITNGTVTPPTGTGNVTWTIDGNPRSGGDWDGEFHSELESYTGHIPDGLTGTFHAEHGPSGTPVARLQGAFGTHKQP